MLDGNGYFQTGMTLIEVLVSVLILAIGLLGAAAVQLNALKYTDSAMAHSQASFIAYDMMDRIRANPDADYRLSSLADAPAIGNLTVPRDQDLYDFAANVSAFAGLDSTANIVLSGGAATITITWNDSRATHTPGSFQTLALSSRVAINRLGAP